MVLMYDLRRWVINLKGPIVSSTSGAFEVIDTLGYCRIEFAFITAMSAQSGTHRPDQVYVLAHVVSEPVAAPSTRFEGLVLELSTLEFFPPQTDVFPPQGVQVADCGSMIRIPMLHIFWIFQS